MLAYYGSRISDHMTETPEGFLICHNVPINRTGQQEYLRREIGLEGDGLVTVIRADDEVFSREALSSFEGKPVTQDHPPGSVQPYNYGMYTKGHAQNIHRGVGEESDCSMADLFINDPDLIRAIKDGLREVSCGYECVYVPDGKGHYYQQQIRGNHVAVVAAGRAGHRVSIKDSMPESDLKERIEKIMNEKRKKPSFFSKFFVHWAADQEPEEAAAVLDELLETPENPQSAPQEDNEPENVSPAPASPVAQQTDSPEVIALLKQVLAKLEGGEAAQNSDPLQKLADELAGGVAAPAANPAAPAAPEDQESSVTVPAEEMKTGDEDTGELTGSDLPRNPIPGADSALAIINAVRPYIAKLPEKERRAAADSMTQAVRQMRGMNKKATSDGYAAIQQAMKQAGNKGKSAADESMIGKNIMKKYNPHYKN